MHDGELVVLPLKTTGTIAVGRISGPYEHRSDLGPDLTHVRPVRWERTEVARDAFDQDLLYSFGAFSHLGGSGATGLRNVFSRPCPWKSGPVPCCLCARWRTAA